MTAYTIHPDEIYDVGKPILGSTHLEARDNLIAMTEGDDAAPNIQFAALGRLTAGESLRVQGPDVLVTGASTFGSSITHGFLQVGTVRCVVSYVSGQVTTRRIVRARNGVSTTIASAGGTADLTADVSVIHGDTLSLQGSGGADTGTGTHSAQIKVASGNLWVGVGGRVEGNNNV